jgi:hypothetical protein
MFGSVVRPVVHDDDFDHRKRRIAGKRTRKDRDPIVGRKN